ncbi:hypothetical protein [Propylenella binzhouense]|nr:hypothetical protein [Propylenella binzhouense]
MSAFFKARGGSRADHRAVFAEFAMQLLGVLLERRMRRQAAPRFRVVR